MADRFEKRLGSEKETSHGNDEVAIIEEKSTKPPLEGAKGEKKKSRKKRRVGTKKPDIDKKVTKKSTRYFLINFLSVMQVIS